MFMFLETDGFASRFKDRGKSTQIDYDTFDPEKGDPRSTVRRPYRGIQIKQDTYASLSVIKATGDPIPLTSSSARVTQSAGSARTGEVNDYSDFILQRIDDQRAEKQQIVETFGEPFIYFFGERPRIVSFSGMLINTEDFNWRAQFWSNYEEHLRGTKLVQANARVYLTYDTILLEGYPIAASAQDAAEMPYSVPFQMQMIMTNYHDFSSIGRTRFPGALSIPDTEALNKALQDKRAKYVSTTAAVRRKNIESRGPKGILAEMRKGIRGVNTLMNVAGNFVQKAGQVMGGRVVRVPVGIAGYLSSLGEEVYISGVNTTGKAGAEDALTTSLNNRIAAFQKYVGVTGSVKVRAPALAQFSPSWVSGVDGKFRGFIWENVDEYPERGQPKGLGDILSKKEESSITERILLRAQKRADYQAKLDAKVLELTSEGGALQDIAERVSFVKSNFGMVMNAKAFIQNPAGVGKAVVGLTASNETLAESLAKRGIMVAPGQLETYIGANALKTFKQTAEGLANAGRSIGDGLEAEAAAIGQSYEQNTYTTTGEDRNYESAYGDSDYTGLVSTVPGSEDSLAEVYGDSDDAADGSDVDPDAFAEVYGADTQTPTTPSVEKQAGYAFNAQSSTPTGTTDSVIGIRGVGDDDAAIEPVI